MNDLVSLIIPVYNVEKYLCKCLDSVVNQTYKNIEVILVNDGSTDSSGEICKCYSDKYSNIIYLSQKNKGLSAARNLALEYVTGEYICFLDSDDYLDEAFVEKLYKAIKEYDADIIQCGVWEIHSGNVLHTDNTKEIKYLSNKDAIIRLLKWGYEDLLVRPAVWNKMFKRNIVENIRFWEGRISEDYYYSFEAFSKSKKIVLLPDNLYFHIYTNEDSITRKPFSSKRLDLLVALEYIIDNCNDKEIENTGYISAINSINHFYYDAAQLENVTSILTLLNDKLKDYRSKCELNTIPNKIRFRSFCILNIPRLYLQIMKLYRKRVIK